MLQLSILLKGNFQEGQIPNKQTLKYPKNKHWFWYGPGDFIVNHADLNSTLEDNELLGYLKAIGLGFTFLIPNVLHLLKETPL